MSLNLTTAASGASHTWQRNINWKFVARLAPTGMIGGAIGAYVLSNVEGGVIEPFISVYLIGIGFFILVKAFRPLQPRQRSDKLVPLIGLAGGTLDAMGGGGCSPEQDSNRDNMVIWVCSSILISVYNGSWRWLVLGGTHHGNCEEYDLHLVRRRSGSRG